MTAAPEVEPDEVGWLRMPERSLWSSREGLGLLTFVIKQDVVYRYADTFGLEELVEEIKFTDPDEQGPPDELIKELADELIKRRGELIKELVQETMRADITFTEGWEVLVEAFTYQDSDDGTGMLTIECFGPAGESLGVFVLRRERFRRAPSSEEGDLGLGITYYANRRRATLPP